MSGVAFLNQLLNHRVEFSQDLACNLGLLLHKDLERVSITVLVSLREDFVENERVVSIEGENHIAAVLIRLALTVDVFDHFTSESVQN